MHALGVDALVPEVNISIPSPSGRCDARLRVFASE
jgi:hypothetical protein